VNTNIRINTLPSKQNLIILINWWVFIIKTINEGNKIN
jgi:hypothetical protein